MNFSFLSLLFFINVVVITFAFVKLGIADDGVSFGAQSSSDVSHKYLFWSRHKIRTQPVFTCSKLTTETLEQGVKYVQS